VQLLVSDSDVESYKQIKADLDVLRQSVEKSELWVYKSKVEEHGNKKKKSKEEEDEGTAPRKTPMLSTTDKQGFNFYGLLIIHFLIIMNPLVCQRNISLYLLKDLLSTWISDHRCTLIKLKNTKRFS